MKKNNIRHIDSGRIITIIKIAIALTLLILGAICLYHINEWIGKYGYKDMTAIMIRAMTSIMLLSLPWLLIWAALDDLNSVTIVCVCLFAFTGIFGSMSATAYIDYKVYDTSVMVKDYMVDENSKTIYITDTEGYTFQAALDDNNTAYYLNKNFDLDKKKVSDTDIQINLSKGGFKIMDDVRSE